MVRVVQKDCIVDIQYSNGSVYGWIERRLSRWVCGFSLNCDLQKIPVVEKIGKEKLSNGLRMSL